MLVIGVCWQNDACDRLINTTYVIMLSIYAADSHN